MEKRAAAPLIHYCRLQEEAVDSRATNSIGLGTRGIIAIIEAAVLLIIGLVVIFR